MPNTNFSEAKLTVNTSTNPTEIKNCTADLGGTEATISGYSFKKYISTDAGAGNFYETTSYKGLLDGDCYRLEYTIHSTNIGNYPPELGIKEFDKAKVQDELERIVQSFKFLINSD